MKSPRHFGFHLLLLILFIGCIPNNQEATAQFHIDENGLIDEFIGAESLVNATVAVKAVDVNSGQVLLSHNASLTMVPASIQKLLTTAAVLGKLPSDHTFTTKVEYSGWIDEAGTLNGDLRIEGGGDPAFASSNFNRHYGDVFERIGTAVMAAGIRKIEGNVIGDASIFGEIVLSDTWIWEDIGNYFGASATGLNIFDNSYEITFSTGDTGSLTTIVGIVPEIPGLEFENQVLAADDNRDNAYIYGSYLSGKRIIRGTIPANRNAFTIKGAIPDPALVAAHLLKSTLEALGIEITDEPQTNFTPSTPSKRTLIIEIESPPLAELVKVTNFKSQNLYAETLLLHLSQSIGSPSIENGCQVVKAFWEQKGMSVEGMFLEDGSGLSRANGLTADQIMFVLKYMAQQSGFDDVFLKSLPLAGVSGNLTSFGKGTLLENNLAAKSGTMTRVFNYAGYLTSTSGREVAFVVMVNNYSCTPAEMKALLSRLLLRMTTDF